MNQVAYDIRLCDLADVHELCSRFHGYKSAGSWAAYTFAIYEEGRIVAAYAWQPPPVGAAQAVCPEAPQGVLALSRMVAVPKAERKLKHVSKPLRYQMRKLIDRTRWPVLITFHDEGQGHTGHVYKCSGWERTGSRTAKFYTDAEGRRKSSFSNGGRARNLVKGGKTVIHRWEHWVCPRGEALKWMCDHGWQRVPVPGRVWRSGNPAYTFIKVNGSVPEPPRIQLRVVPVTNTAIKPPWL